MPALSLGFHASAQTVTNIVLVGQKGVIDDLKKATSFIVVKQFPTHFERLDYKNGGPMGKSRCFKDSNLTVLEGSFYQYRPNGIACMQSVAM